MRNCSFNSRFTGTRGLVRFVLTCLLTFFAFAPAPLKASFTGDYALENFTLTQINLNAADQVPPNGSAEISPEGWLVLTGSNTGSQLFPGSNTDLTIASRGTGLVSFDWIYSSLDIPEWDIAGYIVDTDFNALADTNGQSGSVSFPVIFGQTFGFRVWTLDNAGEPGVLTVKNFNAPGQGQSAVPEPGTSAFLLLALTAGITARPLLRRMSSARERCR